VTDLEILGRRLVACRHFRPMRGMRDLQGRTWDEALLWRWSNEFDVPDLSDPATLGCLLALVREALNVPTAHVLPSLGAWYIERDAQDGSEDNEWLHVDGVWGCGSAAVIETKTEAEALVAALEAAP